MLSIINKSHKNKFDSAGPSMDTRNLPKYRYSECGIVISKIIMNKSLRLTC